MTQMSTVPVFLIALRWKYLNVHERMNKQNTEYLQTGILLGHKKG